MRLNQKLIAGFFAIALLVAVAGFVGYYSISIIKEQTAISDAARDMGLNVNADRSNLHQYLLTEDPDELTQLYESTEKFDALTKMWLQALGHGTDSAEFQSNDAVYKTWEEGGYEAKGRSVRFDPEIAVRAREIEELWETSEITFFEVTTAHDGKLVAKARFADEYPKERDMRHALRDSVYMTNDPTLLKDISDMSYYSKEALFQYGDEEHLNEWYDSITTLKTDAAVQAVFTPEELGAFSASCDAYYLVAKRMGDLTLDIKQLETEELAKLAVFDEYVAKIKDHEEEIISITTIRTNETKARATSILIAVTIFTLVLGLGTGFSISRSISKPVNKLMDVAVEIGKGNLDAKIEIESRDEIGALAASFSKMRQDLKDSIFAKAAIIDGMPDAVGVLDLHGRIVQINRAAEANSGYTREELIGSPFEQFLAKHSLPRLAEAQKSETERGVVRDLELVAVRKDGTEYAILFNTAQLTDTDGTLVGIIFTIKDITERKQAEEERERLLKELEIRTAEMERFVYTISHELRTPLVTVQGYTDLLRRDVERNEERQVETDLKFIENAVTSISLLLKDTLELSRTGRVINQLEDVPFGVLIRDALTRLADQIKLSGVEVSVADDFLPTVHVDRVKIIEVLVNLIENGIKFMGDQPHPKIEVGYRMDGEETVFFVKDNGIGLDKNQHEKVFELFYKVDKKSKGTGAGLAIVKRIIEAHKGRIWIESQKGEGCTVCFTLPTR